MDVPQVTERAPTPSFDYAQMDEAARLEARAVVERYRGRQKAYVMDTGRDLLAVKERLEHGLFLAWVQAEMGLTARTAQNLMQVAAQLGHKSEIVSHLPPTLLYKLAAPSIPAPVRDEIMGRLEAGEAVSPKQIDAQLWVARREAQREAKATKLSPEQRKHQQKLKRAREARSARDRAKFVDDLDQERSRREAAATELAELLSPLLDDETYLKVYELLRDCEPRALREKLSAAYGPTAEAQAMAGSIAGLSHVDGSSV